MSDNGSLTGRILVILYNVIGQRLLAYVSEQEIRGWTGGPITIFDPCLAQERRVQTAQGVLEQVEVRPIDPFGYVSQLVVVPAMWYPVLANSKFLKIHEETILGLKAQSSGVVVPGPGPIVLSKRS